MKNDPQPRPAEIPGTRSAGPAGIRPASSSSSSSSSSSPPPRRRRWGWIILAALVVLAVVGYFTARPAWRAVKGFRAQRFLADAEDAMRKEEWTRAFERTRSALQLAPFDTRVVRHAALLHGKFGLESAMRYYEQLLSSGKATLQDREEYAAVAIGLGSAELAGTHIEELLDHPNPSARSLLLGAQYYSLRRDLPRAILLARQSVAAEPGNATNHLSLASLLSTSRRPADQAEARATLWPLARTNGIFQVRALGAILSTPDAPRADREEVEAILAAQDKRSLEQELLLLETRVSLDPSKRARIADEVVERFGRGSPTEMAAAANWLNRQQLFGRTRDLLLPDIAGRNETLFRLRYDALVGLNDLRGAYEFILADSAPGDPFRLEFLRCNTALLMKDDAAVESHLKNLIGLGRQSPRQLRAVADFALRNRRLEIANQANQILSRNPREAATSFRALLRSADAQGETWVARDYARKLALIRKDDEAIKLQIAYYDLLLDENIDQAFATVDRLQQAKPEDFNRRAVLALALLRRNEPGRAVPLIDGQIVMWGKLPPGIRAIVVATLGANGRTTAAARLIGRLPLAQLKPEERELIRPYLTENMFSDTEEPRDERPEKL